MGGKEYTSESAKNQHFADDLIELTLAFASLTHDHPELLETDIETWQWNQYLTELVGEFEKSYRSVDVDDAERQRDIRAFALETIPDLYESRAGKTWSGRAEYGTRSAFERGLKKPALLPDDNLREWLITSVGALSPERIVFTSLTDPGVQDFDLQRAYRSPEIPGRESFSCVYDQNLDTVYFCSHSGRFTLPEDCRSLFAELTDLKAIEGLERLDATGVLDMAGMFCDCWFLEKAEVSSWDVSNVTAMNSMFGGCCSLTSLDISKWDTSSVTNMAYMFSGCRSLERLDTSRWDTSHVTTMASMFGGCNSLERVYNDRWDTSSVTDMSGMFYGCESLFGMDLSTFNIAPRSSNNEALCWDTHNVRSMARMFFGCKSLSDLRLHGWDTSKVESMYYMFKDCSSLKYLDLEDFDTSNVTSMQYMFYGCSSLETVAFSGVSCAKDPQTKDMFGLCDNLKTVLLPKAPLAARLIKKEAASAIARNEPEKILGR